ncbi:MAG: hypothetical protein CL816_00925 [Coxiellaceae bacterium]|nr:hypothetical protein [Coxiellaceae bacterium]|tara:strand:- start:3649 stop:4191 length:543 start_codon:yes stop_codon:yes gene_type:complete
MSNNQNVLLNDNFKILHEIEELPLYIYKGTFAILNLRDDLSTYLASNPNSVRQFQVRQILQPIEQLIKSFNLPEKTYELIEEHQQAGNGSSKFSSQAQLITSIRKTRQQCVTGCINYRLNFDEYKKEVICKIHHVKKEIKDSYFAKRSFFRWLLLGLRHEENSRLYKIISGYELRTCSNM